jgi:hypothetical protein
MVEHALENLCVKERFKRTISRQWQNGVLSNANVVMLLESSQAGNNLDWHDFAEGDVEGELDLSDDDAVDMGVKAAPAKKVEQARVERGGVASVAGAVHVETASAAFKM